MLTWVLNAWHHQFLCNMTSCVQDEVQTVQTNLKAEPYRLASTCEHDLTFSRSRSSKSELLSKPLYYDFILMLTTFPQCKVWTEIPRTARPKSYMLSLTEYGWELQNNALWDSLWQLCANVAEVFILLRDVNLKQATIKSIELINAHGSPTTSLHPWKRSIGSFYLGWEKTFCNFRS